jgi:predicted dehydrogenase
MRVAIIGARRVQQGLGPFLARFAVQAGGEVCAAVGTSVRSAEQACADIHADTGSTPVAAVDINGVLAAGAEALIIASPHETHQRWLEDALASGLHVLCEKPLVWGSADPAGDAERIAAGFLGRGLHLHLNTQWPLTLESFRALCPDAPSIPRQFHMSMPPRLTGLPALLDCLPHPLSMLAAIAPDAEASVSHIGLQADSADSALLRLAFDYNAQGQTIFVQLKLDSSPDPLRTTRYAFDQHAVTRVVDPTTYAMTLATESRRIPLPDPTPRLVRSFLDATAAGAPSRSEPAAVPGMRHLAQLMTAAAHQLEEAHP